MLTKAFLHAVHNAIIKDGLITQDGKRVKWDKITTSIDLQERHDQTEFRLKYEFHNGDLLVSTHETDWLILGDKHSMCWLEGSSLFHLELN